ncbi:MAG: hypothetical protein V3T72_02510 [Thermoanaerobaculia bacterium]
MARKVAAHRQPSSGIGLAEHQQRGDLDAGTAESLAEAAGELIGVVAGDAGGEQLLAPVLELRRRQRRRRRREREVVGARAGHRRIFEGGGHVDLASTAAAAAEHL